MHVKQSIIGIGPIFDIFNGFKLRKNNVNNVSKREVLIGDTCQLSIDELNFKMFHVSALFLHETLMINHRRILFGVTIVNVSHQCVTFVFCLSVTGNEGAWLI